MYQNSHRGGFGYDRSSDLEQEQNPQGSSTVKATPSEDLVWRERDGVEVKKSRMIWKTGTISRFTALPAP
jgi:hypothetical protein